MENTKNDLLIYGVEYKLFREGEFIGYAKWVNDENIGDSFINTLKDGTKHVYTADEWYIDN